MTEANVQIEGQRVEAGDGESELELEGIAGDEREHREEDSAERPRAHVQRRDDGSPLPPHNLQH